MGESSSTFDEVILEVEGSQLRCNKKELALHSDYFKIMFEGNFIERHQKVIKLEGVQLKALNIILTLLWDERYFIHTDDLLLVVQTACMLQFVQIQNMCIDKIQEMLSPKNCLNIWLTCETLDLKPLNLKAKSLALMEFQLVKDSPYLLEMNINQLYTYLANRNLKCENEMSVFQTCMKWWYENSENSENVPHTLLTLLHCVNFRILSCSDIREMQSYPDICDNTEILSILNCVIDLKNNAVLNYSEDVIPKAQVLLEAENRIYQEYPCFLVKNVIRNVQKEKLKLGGKEELVVVHYVLNRSNVPPQKEFLCKTEDKFRRKRHYSLVEHDHEMTPSLLVYYEINSGNLKKLLNIENQKCESLYGFKLIGYKEYIFRFGGEFLIGKGNWNTNLWVYDSIRERWERKCVMPFVRRHFESCVCGNYLYVIGGTGEFRVVQENMFWYNYSEDKWSCRILLPCPGRQLKCCQYKNQLFLLSISNKCGYIFDDCTANWLKIDICDKDTIIPSLPDKFILFSYKDHIFIKGGSLIELELVGQKLVVVSNKSLDCVNCDYMESVLCNDSLYTMYKTMGDDELDRLTLEKFCMRTHTVTRIIDRATDDTEIEVDESKCVPRMSPNLFSFHHYQLIEKDEFITDYVL